MVQAVKTIQILPRIKAIHNILTRELKRDGIECKFDLATGRLDQELTKIGIYGISELGIADRLFNLLNQAGKTLNILYDLHDDISLNATSKVKCNR
ncbi:MAG: hypothetical protein QNJ31_03120 [Candidatus Caenarcaniphilales bacterium]|nr:hypothetical protein [Candidatus Caenarcaniphilales bacterium]